jgi:hypothetical protein
MNGLRLGVGAVAVVVAASVAGVAPAASTGVAEVPAAGPQLLSDGVRGAQHASVVELTDAHGRRSAAAVAGFQRQATGSDRGAQPAPGGPAEAQVRAAVLSGPIATGLFRVAGLSWDRDADLAPGTEIHLRVREDGVWSEWLQTPDEQGPETGGRHGTAPFVTGGADAIQVRVTGGPADLPAGLHLNVIQGAGEPSPAGSTATSIVRPAVFAQPAVARRAAVETGVVAAVLPQPAIVNRAGWAANESLRKGFVATTAELRATVVHHTAGTNSYSSSQSPQIVRDIYYMHAVTNGWGDLAYNFLVDKYGTVFEGRYGSIASPEGQMRVGAYAQGFNTYSMGIAAMGDYSSIAADQTILDRMRDVIVWRFSSTPTLNMATPAYFPANTYHTTDRYLPRIFGHRDVLATVCPGDDIHGRIPALITAVTDAMGGAPPEAPNTAPVANAGADRTARAGTSVTLIGTGTDADKDPLTYRWAQTGGTPTVDLATAGTAQASFTAPALPSGSKSLTLTFTLTVTDDSGATGTDSVVVKVIKR